MPGNVAAAATFLTFYYMFTRGSLRRGDVIVTILVKHNLWRINELYFDRIEEIVIYAFMEDILASRRLKFYRSHFQNCNPHQLSTNYVCSS